MTWRSLLTGCFRHHLIWSKRTADDGSERTVQECIKCGDVVEVLPQPAILGPAHQPAPVRGVPKVVVKTMPRLRGLKWSNER